MKGRIRFWAEEDGAIAVIVAVSISIILILSAFIMDYGLAYVKASEIQNAADAASLAAGQQLPVKMDSSVEILKIKNAAIAYAAKNGATNLTESNITLSDAVNGKYTSIRVSVPCTVPSYFGKTVGINSYSFTRSAKTKIAPCTQCSGVAPLGVEYSQLKTLIATNDTQHIYLKYGGGDGEEGSYGAIDLDGVTGGGANDFTAWLQFGYDGVISVGDDLLPVEKGNMSGPTEDAVSARFNACTHFPDLGGCTAEHYDLTCPRIIKILVIEKVGTSYVKVKGFAAFVLEGVGENGEVLGSYLKYFDDGNPTSNNVWTDSDYGLYSLGLAS